ncbi:histone deacetylase family protein [Pyrococcus yayanosii]|uniref:Histone deacetylase n=1 Tax=Pyrococcus yayanosii (strain CH1 / JCM 16557) TaxID=529709 RepID=F8AHG0_PYRYC|nr:histone deacetylase family protein [Pyrococcus yayanosii]AEH24157.1 histone deacetylase [Pyrococcus yayanosii CH1]
MIPTTIFYSPKFLDHRPRGYHPENPGRLALVLEALRERGLWANVKEPNPISEEELLSIHAAEYVEAIRTASKSFTYIDPDTYVSPGTWEAALLAMGAAREAALLGTKERGLHLVLSRPPGHHAGRSGRALGAPTLGFCIFNNAAAAARVVKDEKGKALVIDFDAHHGNGTQEIFWTDSNVVHVDIHERDIYPWTGYEADIGGKGAEGSKVNIPMPHYAGDDNYILAWNEVVLPIVEALKPKVIIVSAGFDGFKGENLTTLMLTERFFHHAGATLSNFSVVMVLEGGYGVGLKKGLPAFIEGYERGEPIEEPRDISYETLRIIRGVKEVQKEWWQF